jgi:hypothetical protein
MTYRRFRPPHRALMAGRVNHHPPGNRVMQR